MSALASGDIHYVAGVGLTRRAGACRLCWFASQRLRLFDHRPAGVQVAERFARQADRGHRAGRNSEVVLRIGLEAAGENAKDFIIIGLGAAQLMSGLESGSIEAANFNPPFYTSRTKGFARFSTSARMPRMSLGGLTASNTSIRNTHCRVEADHPLYANRPADASSGERKDVDFIVRAIKVDRQTAEDSYETMGRRPAAAGFPAARVWNRS